MISSYVLALVPHGKLAIVPENNQKVAIDIQNQEQPVKQARPLGYTSTSYTLLKTYDRPQPHYYTQGLTFAGPNILLESAGLYGESAIHLLSLDDLSTQNQVKMEPKYFAEGTDFVLNEQGQKEIYQLTWRERDVIVYDADTFARKSILQLPSQIREGWGLARKYDDENGQKVQNLYITDGSARVYVCEPNTLLVKRTLDVKDGNGSPVALLNELEFVKGKLWANIYTRNTIAVIDIDSGNVEKFMDFTNLVETAKKNFVADRWNTGYCLNGIAYHPDTERLIVTGKKWPHLYEIQVDDD